MSISHITWELVRNTECLEPSELLEVQNQNLFYIGQDLQVAYLWDAMYSFSNWATDWNDIQSFERSSQRF